MEEDTSKLSMRKIVFSGQYYSLLLSFWSFFGSIGKNSDNYETVI